MKGVTLSQQAQTANIVISIHTPVKGVTIPENEKEIVVELFQSTLPWREWRSMGFVKITDEWEISIHTPVKGVTPARKML